MKIITILITVLFLLTILPISNANISNIKISQDNNLEDYIKGEVIIGLKHDNIITTDYPKLIESYYNAEILDKIEEINTVVVKVDDGKEQEYINKIISHPEVEYAELNYIYHICDEIPNDPRWDEQWGLKAINCGKAWEQNGFGDKDIIIAILDTGIDYNHEDISNNYVPLGKDWFYNDDDPMDSNGHGTHCAGIAAGVINNYIGIAGIAQASVMAEKVMSNLGSGDSKKISKGIIHATDVGADIISMSFHSSDNSNTVENACNYAWDNNVVLVAAAGNDGIGVINTPAAYDNVIAVGAIDSSIAKTDFSCYGSELELMAPGDDILSLIPNDKYKSWGGTSMATPHAAGVAALIKSIGYKTNEEIREILRKSAIDLDPFGWDEKNGYGLVDASLKGLSVGGKNLLYFGIHNIEQLDDIEEDPDWYLEIYIRNIERDVEFKSKDNWDSATFNILYVQDSIIELNITLKEKDFISSQTIDISSDPDRKTLSILYDLSRSRVIEETSDIVYIEEGRFVADGESDNNEEDECDAKLKFILTAANDNSPKISDVLINGEKFVDTSLKFSANIVGGKKPFKWLWDFGDGASSSDKQPAHVYDKSGAYLISLMVIDSECKAPYIFHKLVNILNTQPPEIRDVSGDTYLEKNTVGEYNAVAIDPNDLDIKYGWDWNDDEVVDEWSNWFGSGENCTVKHFWEEEGIFKVRVKAKNENGLESEFESISVSVPINKNIFQNILYWIIKIINARTKFPIYK